MEERSITIYGLGIIGIFCIIVGLVRQAYQFNGHADWLSNDLYVAGVFLIVIGVFIGIFWKDN